MGYLIEIHPLSGHITWAKPEETVLETEPENIAPAERPEESPPPHRQIELDLNG